jgi:hypothetical protein
VVTGNPAVVDTVGLCTYTVITVTGLSGDGVNMRYGSNYASTTTTFRIEFALKAPGAPGAIDLVINVEFEDDPGVQPPLTLTAYSYGGAGFPDDVSDLTLVGEVFADVDTEGSYPQALPAGKSWLHLEQDAVGWGWLVVGLP